MFWSPYIDPQVSNLHSGIYPNKITAENMVPSMQTINTGKSMDEILAISPTEKEPVATWRKPGLVTSGRCITEREFLQEVK